MNLIELMNYLNFPLWTRWVSAEGGEISAHSHRPFSSLGELVCPGTSEAIGYLPVENCLLRVSPTLDSIPFPGQGWFAQDIDGEVARFGERPVLGACGIWEGKGHYVGWWPISVGWMFPTERI